MSITVVKFSIFAELLHSSPNTNYLRVVTQADFLRVLFRDFTRQLLPFKNINPFFE